MDTENQREVAKPLTLDHDDLTRRFPLESVFIVCAAWKRGRWWCRGLVSATQIAGACRTHQQCEVCRFETIYAPEQMPGQQDRFIGGG